MPGRGGGRDRGAYSQPKCGSGRRGGSGGHEAGPSHQDQRPNDADPIQQSYAPAKGWNALADELERIDGKRYIAYRALHKGSYVHSDPNFTLMVDHFQEDFNVQAPSRVRVVMSWADTGIPEAYIQNETRKIAFCDFSTRLAAAIIQAKFSGENVEGQDQGSSESRSFSITDCGQEVLPRTSAMLSETNVIELRFGVFLPANDGKVPGRRACQVLCVDLVELVERTLQFTAFHRQELLAYVYSVEEQSCLRREMEKHDLVAFVANGSILPRASGHSQAPLDELRAVPFQSPPELQIGLRVPTDHGEILCVGMGIRKGITLLTGGGFHGKSTLLKALELGIYNHVPGDGRERVVSLPTAMKIRTEDGRCVSKVDISPFISALPGGESPTMFSSQNASGSASMAANIQEALEVGCKLLLIDEDSSATNLLVRDRRLHQLTRHDPITPLISRARALSAERGVSTVMVVGGLGDWLGVADWVITMDSYRALFMNDEALALIDEFPNRIPLEPDYNAATRREFLVNFAGHLPPRAASKGYISIKSKTKIASGDPKRMKRSIDLRALKQIVDIGQVRMIAMLLRHIEHITTTEGPLSTQELWTRLEASVGIDKCLPTSLENGDAVAVRFAELASTLFRMRGMVTVATTLT